MRKKIRKNLDRNYVRKYIYVGASYYFARKGLSSEPEKNFTFFKWSVPKEAFVTKEE